MNDNYALTSLYHPTGAKVSIPMDMDNPLTDEQASALFKSTWTLINAGFSVNAPGLEEGELKQEVNAVCRRAANDEHNTPIIAFYAPHPKLVKKFIHKYMNTPDDIADFEKATGLKLESLPLYDGDQFPDKDGQKGAKYVKAISQPIEVVWKISEKWSKWNTEGKEGNEPQKRIFVRYEGFSNSSAPVVRADPATGEISDTGDQFKKSDPALVNAIMKKTGLKPTSFMPILSAVPGETISLENAVALIQANNATEK